MIPNAYNYNMFTTRYCSCAAIMVVVSAAVNAREIFRLQDFTKMETDLEIGHPRSRAP